MLKGWVRPTVIIIAFATLVFVASWWSVKSTVEQRVEQTVNALYWSELGVDKTAMKVCLGNLKTAETLFSSWSGAMWVLRNDELRERVRLLLKYNTGFNGEQYVACNPPPLK